MALSGSINIMNQNPKIAYSVNCSLCGCNGASVRCEKCNSMAFCIGCDDMYHRHPKRRNHLRQAVALEFLRAAEKHKQQEQKQSQESQGHLMSTDISNLYPWRRPRTLPRMPEGYLSPIPMTKVAPPIAPITPMPTGLIKPTVNSWVAAHPSKMPVPPPRRKKKLSFSGLKESFKKFVNPNGQKSQPQHRQEPEPIYATIIKPISGVNQSNVQNVPTKIPAAFRPLPPTPPIENEQIYENSDVKKKFFASSADLREYENFAARHNIYSNESMVKGSNDSKSLPRRNMSCHDITNNNNKNVSSATIGNHHRQSPNRQRSPYHGASPSPYGWNCENCGHHGSTQSLYPGTFSPNIYQGQQCLNCTHFAQHQWANSQSFANIANGFGMNEHGSRCSSRNDNMWSNSMEELIQCHHHQHHHHRHRHGNRRHGRYLDEDDDEDEMSEEYEEYDDDDEDGDGRRHHHRRRTSAVSSATAPIIRRTHSSFSMYQNMIDSNRQSPQMKSNASGSMKSLNNHPYYHNQSQQQQQQQPQPGHNQKHRPSNNSLETTTMSDNSSSSADVSSSRKRNNSNKRNSSSNKFNQQQQHETNRTKEPELIDEIVNDHGQWSCRFCTFFNDPDKKICDICCKTRSEKINSSKILSTKSKSAIDLSTQKPTTVPSISSQYSLRNDEFIIDEALIREQLEIERELQRRLENERRIEEENKKLAEISKEQKLKEAEIKATQNDQPQPKVETAIKTDEPKSDSKDLSVKLEPSIEEPKTVQPVDHEKIVAQMIEEKISEKLEKLKLNNSSIDNENRSNEETNSKTKETENQVQSLQTPIPQPQQSVPTQQFVPQVDPLQSQFPMQPLAQYGNVQSMQQQQQQLQTSQYVSYGTINQPQQTNGYGYQDPYQLQSQAPYNQPSTYNQPNYSNQNNQFLNNLSMQPNQTLIGGISNNNNSNITNGYQSQQSRLFQRHQSWSSDSSSLATRPLMNRFSSSDDLQSISSLTSAGSYYGGDPQKVQMESGLHIIQTLRDAEKRGYNADDVEVAIQFNPNSPLDWLDENWPNMCETVLTMANNQIIELERSSLSGMKKNNFKPGFNLITEKDARIALRICKGNIWQAVEKCIQRYQDTKAGFGTPVKSISTKTKSDIAGSNGGAVPKQSKSFSMKVSGYGSGKTNNDSYDPNSSEMLDDSRSDVEEEEIENLMNPDLIYQEDINQMPLDSYVTLKDHDQDSNELVDFYINKLDSNEQEFDRNQMETLLYNWRTEKLLMEQQREAMKRAEKEKRKIQKMLDLQRRIGGYLSDGTTTEEELDREVENVFASHEELRAKLAEIDIEEIVVSDSSENVETPKMLNINMENGNESVTTLIGEEELHDEDKFDEIEQKIHAKLEQILNLTSEPKQSSIDYNLQTDLLTVPKQNLVKSEPVVKLQLSNIGIPIARQKPISMVIDKVQCQQFQINSESIQKETQIATSISNGKKSVKKVKKLKPKTNSIKKEKATSPQTLAPTLRKDSINESSSSLELTTIIESKNQQLPLNETLPSTSVIENGNNTFECRLIPQKPVFSKLKGDEQRKDAKLQRNQIHRSEPNLLRCSSVENIRQINSVTIDQAKHRLQNGVRMSSEELDRRPSRSNYEEIHNHQLLYKSKSIDFKHFIDEQRRQRARDLIVFKLKSLESIHSISQRDLYEPFESNDEKNSNQQTNEIDLIQNQQSVDIKWSRPEYGVDFQWARTEFECELCANIVPVDDIVSMIACTHFACRDCLRQYLTVQIRERQRLVITCPFCDEPSIGADEDEKVFDYLGMFDPLIRHIVDPDVYDMFQRKLRDRALMRDPNFLWCAQCSSGFIAPNPEALTVLCPDCRQLTCRKCKKPWKKQHFNVSCEAYAEWEMWNDPQYAEMQLNKHLKEFGIECPNCKFRYQLAKGGCMHFRCIQCSYDFCGGCSRPFKLGNRCFRSRMCASLGLHAHHPRHCLFYLRDKDVEVLRQLLDENKIEYITELEGDKQVITRCQVMEQKETDDGMRDEACNRFVESAGLCKYHYKEYLGTLIFKNQIDPINVFNDVELEMVLRRENVRIPNQKVRPVVTTTIKEGGKLENADQDEEYRKRLIELIHEKVPLDLWE